MAIKSPVRWRMRWRVVGLIAACAAVAHAQTSPPIKPGLWQVKNVHMLDGQKAPDMSEHLKNMPPEARKRMEATLKQQGVDIGGGGGMKVCMTRESLDSGRWRSEESGCKTEYSSRTATLWKWRSVCTQPPSESEGEARITSPERYTVKVSTRLERRGQKHTSDMSMDAQWLGADCGDVKPVSPGPRGARPNKP